MEYEVSASPGRQWQVFFMQFEPNAAHDGFTITRARDLGVRGKSLSGQLAPGRYFVVVLYRGEGEYWICPGTARENGERRLGDISDLCFAENGPSCRVKLTVKPAPMLAQPLPPPP